MKWLAYLPLFLPLVGLTACSTLSESDRYQASRYHQSDDSAPEETLNLEHIPDAVPKYEPKSAGGNKPLYTVRGKSYRVLANAEGFSEIGEASWYGKKFHGHKTSNGEIYDMYSMSAAHKNLPLPSYVKVTHLGNHKQVIVRVNDRGPFHAGRIIDLSYAAAYKLDMLKTGTSRVKIEAITTPPPWLAPTPALVPKVTTIATALPSTQPTIAAPLPTNPKPQAKSQPIEPLKAEQLFLQITVTGDADKAEHLVIQLGELFEIAARKVQEQNLYKVQLGPFETEQAAESLLLQLKQGEFSSAFKVYAQ